MPVNASKRYILYSFQHNGQVKGVGGSCVKKSSWSYMKEFFISFSALFTELKADVVWRNCATAKLGRYFGKSAFPLYSLYEMWPKMTQKPNFFSQNGLFGGFFLPKMWIPWEISIKTTKIPHMYRNFQNIDLKRSKNGHF